ncbi:hypothetical protein JCM11251_005731 [Rhodosporidiobolus azoricus]
MSTPGVTISPSGTPGSGRRYVGTSTAASSARSRRRGRLLLLGLVALLVLLTVIIVPPAVVLTRDNKNNTAQQNVRTTVVDGVTRTISGDLVTRTGVSTLANGEVTTFLDILTLPDVTVSETQALQSVATEYITSTLTDGAVVVLQEATELVTEVATYTFTASNGESFSLSDFSPPSHLFSPMPTEDPSSSSPLASPTPTSPPASPSATSSPPAPTSPPPSSAAAPSSAAPSSAPSSVAPARPGAALFVNQRRRVFVASVFSRRNTYFSCCADFALCADVSSCITVSGCSNFPGFSDFACHSHLTWGFSLFARFFPWSRSAAYVEPWSRIPCAYFAGSTAFIESFKFIELGWRCYHMLRARDQLAAGLCPSTDLDAGKRSSGVGLPPIGPTSSPSSSSSSQTTPGAGPSPTSSPEGPTTPPPGPGEPISSPGSPTSSPDGGVTPCTVSLGFITLPPGCVPEAGPTTPGGGNGGGATSSPAPTSPPVSSSFGVGLPPIGPSSPTSAPTTPGQGSGDPPAPTSRPTSSSSSSPAGGVTTCIISFGGITLPPGCVPAAGPRLESLICSVVCCSSPAPTSATSGVSPPVIGPSPPSSSRPTSDSTSRPSPGPTPPGQNPSPGPSNTTSSPSASSPSSSSSRSSAVVATCLRLISFPPGCVPAPSATTSAAGGGANSTSSTTTTSTRSGISVPSIGFAEPPKQLVRGIIRDDDFVIRLELEIFVIFLVVHLFVFHIVLLVVFLVAFLIVFVFLVFPVFLVVFGGPDSTSSRRKQSSFRFPILVLFAFLNCALEPILVALLERVVQLFVFQLVFVVLVVPLFEPFFLLDLHRFVHRNQLVNFDQRGQHISDWSEPAGRAIQQRFCHRGSLCFVVSFALFW